MNSYTRAHLMRARLPDGMRMVGNIVRAPVLMTLLLLEPIVRIGCGLAMVLGLFACLAFKLSPVGAHFPLAQMLMLSLGFGVFLVLYYGLIALLTR